MYSRIVRPREMRAMNMPTNGAKAIHHAQYITDQPSCHSTSAAATGVPSSANSLSDCCGRVTT